MTVDEAEEACRLLTESAERGNKVVVLLDDAYFGLVYEKGVQKESLFGELATAHENLLAVKIDGATKEDYAWGFRVGFVSFAAKGAEGPVLKALEDKLAGALRSNISSACHLSQSLILEALNNDSYDQEKAEKADLMQRRYEKVKEVLKMNRERFAPVFTPLPFNSGYFMCLKMRQGVEAETVRQTLLASHGIGVIATDNLVRIAFSAVPTDRIPEIFEAVYQVGKA